MPVTYPDALEHWDRSRAFGDPRDFQSFANDMESLHPGEGFGDAANRDGWWTRLSTRLDQSLFHPIAEATTKPLGAAVGGLFGQEEAGARFGESLPRALLETAPLYLAGPEAGVPATIAAAGATGALMGAHTYAETGSAKAATIAGLTGAALPSAGKVGAEALTTALGLGERVAPTALKAGGTFAGGVLPKAGVSQAAFKTSQFFGSQAAQAAINEASLYGTSKTLGEPYDPLSPDFLIQQIPFTVFDAVTMARAGAVPTKAGIAALAKPPEPKAPPYVPPPSKPEQENNIATMITALQAAYLDPGSTPEQKAGALAMANALIRNPKTMTEAAKPGKVVDATAPVTTVTGYAKQYANGNWKVLTLDPEGNDTTVWINGVEPTVNADGTHTFQPRADQISPNVATPFTRRDFGLVGPGEQELPTQPTEWAGFGPDQQRILEENGVPPPPPEMPEDVRQFLRDTADNIELTQQKIGEVQAAIDKNPTGATEIPNLMTPSGVISESGTPLKLFHHTTEDFQLKHFDVTRTGQHGGTDFGPGIYLDPSHDWLSYVEEGAGEKPIKSIETYVSSDAKVYDFTESEYTPTGENNFKDLANSPQANAADVIIHRTPDGRISQVFVRDPKWLVEQPNTVAEIKQSIDAGATPTQAVEKARLQTQAKQLDAAQQQLKMLQERAKVVSTTGGEYDVNKPQAQYGDYVRDENGKNFPTRALAEAYRDADPELADHVVINAGRGRGGFYLARQLNKEVSLEGTKLEQILGTQEAAVAPLESRPDESFFAGMEQLNRASQSPVVFAREGGFDSVPDAILAVRQAKVAFPLMREGKTFEEIQQALAKAKVAGFESKAQGFATMDAVRRGLQSFTDATRPGFTMGSQKPFDENLVNEMGLAHRDQSTAIRNVIQWFIDQPESGPLGEFARAVLNAHGTEGISLVQDPHAAWHYGAADRTITFQHLPETGKGLEFASKVLHEYVHDVIEKAFLGENTPTAVQLRATLKEATDALKLSPEIPAKVRAALKEMPKWYEEYRRSLDPFNFYQNWVNTVGKGQDAWLQFAYGVQDPGELLSTMFQSPLMVDMMTRTKMPARPRTVMEHVSAFVNRVFGTGKVEHDNVFSQVLQSFDNYLTGSRVPPRMIDVGPTLPAGANFLYGIAPYDKERNLLGEKYILPKDGTIPLKEFRFKGGIGKNLTDNEIALYRSLVPDAFSQTQVMATPRRVGREKVPSTEVSYANEFVNVPKLVEGLRKNGPVVETKKLTTEALEEDRTEYEQLRNAHGNMLHDMETQFPGYTLTGGILKGPDGRPFNRIGEQDEVRYRALPRELRDYVERLQDMQRRMEDLVDQAATTGEGATYASIAPKPESQMPGYVEGLVRVPRKEAELHPTTYEEFMRNTGRSDEPLTRELYRKTKGKEAVMLEAPKYTGPHFGAEDTNVLAFYRGYEEPLPDGTKAFHVIEVQSDWAQQRQRAEQVAARDPAQRIALSGSPHPDHPLLQAYEQLALKAAIQHAQEIGATKVIVSDAETAMMTEGHDKHTGRITPNEPAQITDQTGAVRTFQMDSAGRFLEKVNGNWVTKYDPARGDGVPSWVMNAMPTSFGEPSQAAGMRLHYDRLLPSAMEQLTGERGVPVDLGVHKGAKPPTTLIGDHVSAEEAAQYRNNPAYEVVERGSGYFDIRKIDQPAGSPVFKDANGNPKTQITGLSYDISKVPEQQALFEPRPPATTVRQAYNGRDFLRDYLIAEGVKPAALASRLVTIENMFNTGSLDASIKGFESEKAAGLLPATMNTGDLNPDVKNALVSGTPTQVKMLTKNLLMADVPVHEDLMYRMNEDYTAAANLWHHIKDGLIPGELPKGSGPALVSAQKNLEAMGSAIKKQKTAIGRWLNLDNFTVEGMAQTRINGLSSDTRPAPPDPTELQELGQEALGLIDQRRETALAALAQGKGARAANWVRKNFMFQQYLMDLVPATKPILHGLFRKQGTSNFWKNELDAVYEMDPTTKEFDKTRRDANFRVATQGTLSNAASEIKRWNQTEEAEGRKPTLNDPYVKNVLKDFNKTDQAAIVSEANNARAVHEHWTEVTTPKFLAEKNQVTVATAIALREQGMKPDDARDLAGQFSAAMDALKSPQTAQTGIEILNSMRPRMQPDTFLRAFTLTKSLGDLSDDHMAFMRSRPNYVTEQRFGDHRLRMATPDNKPYYKDFDSLEEANAARQRLETQGYTFLDYIPKSASNVPTGGIRDDFIGKLRDLDLQRQTLLAQSLQGVDPNLLATVLPQMNRANDYQDSLQAFTPVPGAGFPKRHFIAGREEINMVENQNLFYGRAVNWMRHQLTRANSELDLLHPDLLSDRELTRQMRDKVTEFLSPDSPLARKMSEFTYNWKLAGNFGVNVLHGIQSLNTGMAALVSETGSVADALGLTMAAQKAVLQRNLTGKWANKDHDWLTRRAGAEGVLGNVTWDGDIGDSKRNALQYAATPLWRKPAAWLANAARTWNNAFFKFNDSIGLISAFDLGRSQGMNYEEAYNFAADVKARGYFTGGKAQRPGFWSALGPQGKAVPQLIASLQTYVNGWFSLLAYNYTRGFGKAPAGMSAAQVLGAKKAFLYQLGAQAVLAGALGLPGVGQGMALVKQATGVDVMSWLRQHLGDLFDEDNTAGGLMTTLALHGATAAFTPIDISGKHMPSVPYIGVTPYKGFDLANLAGAPVSSAADLVTGLLAAAHGDVMGASTILPEVLKGPLRLWQGEGDVRDKAGNLITKLSPFEQFVTALGMKPARVTAAQDVATAVKEASARAAREKSDITDRFATIYRQNGMEQGHIALMAYLKDHPDENGPALVREISRKVINQTTVPDWSQRANVGADLTGLGGVPASQSQRLQALQSTQASLGLQQRPSRRTEALMEEVDRLRQTDPTLSVAEAAALARRERPQRPLSLTVPPEYQ